MFHVSIWNYINHLNWLFSSYMLVNKEKLTHPLFILLTRWCWCISPTVIGGEAGCTLDRLPVPHMGTQSMYSYLRPIKRDQLPYSHVFWTMGESRSTWREPIHPHGKHENFMKKGLRPGFKPGPSCWKATVPPTFTLHPEGEEKLTLVEKWRNNVHLVKCHYQ